MNSIRLTLNKNLENIFQTLEQEYQTLSRLEILKLGLNELFRKNKQEYIYQLNEDEEESLKKAMKSKPSKTLRNSQDIENFCNNI